MLLAQFMRGWTLAEFAVAVVVVAAVIGLVMIALRKFGASPPDWLVQVFWVVVAAVVIIAAIRFVASL